MTDQRPIVPPPLVGLLLAALSGALVAGIAGFALGFAAGRL